jgi:two-component system, NarL family, sensor histidine kinase UhpB
MRYLEPRIFLISNVKKILTLVILLCVTTGGHAQTAIIDSLLQLANKHTGDTNEIRVLQRLGAEFMRKDTDRATRYVYQQISLARSLKTDFGLMSAYSDLVMIHQNTSNMDSAGYYLNRLEIVVKNSSNKKAGIEYARTAGLYYKNQGKYKEALPYLLEALRLLGPSGDKTARPDSRLI